MCTLHTAYYDINLHLKYIVLNLGTNFDAHIKKSFLVSRYAYITTVNISRFYHIILSQDHCVFFFIP